MAIPAGSPVCAQHFYFHLLSSKETTSSSLASCPMGVSPSISPATLLHTQNTVYFPTCPNALIKKATQFFSPCNLSEATLCQ